MAAVYFWGQDIGKLGNEVRLIPHAYVKTFAKRPKNEMADTETIFEPAARPRMGFVPIRSEETLVLVVMVSQLVSG